MSRQIDFTQPLSDDEIAYLKQRDLGHLIPEFEPVPVNPETGIGGQLNEDPASGFDVKSLVGIDLDTAYQIPDLKAILTALGQPITGNKPDLVERLQALVPKPDVDSQ